MGCISHSLCLGPEDGRLTNRA
eukprot:COSAG01_NODE_50486_length_360_cov_0.590909_2_plen_21_part_01